MTFATPLELYTTAYGWTLYNLLWSLFAGMGLALYPFIKMIYDNWRGAAAEASSVDTVGIGSLQRMKWSFAFKSLVFVLCVLPITELKMDKAKYVKACAGESRVERAFGDTGTTWDDMAAAPFIDGDAYVPVLFHIVMQLAAGTNHTVVNNMPCIPDVVEMRRQLRSLTMPNPTLKGEYDRFVNECYLRARSKLMDTIKRPAKYPTLYSVFEHKRNAFELKGEDFSQYDELDSEILAEAPGLYKPCNDMKACGNTLQAQGPVNGFKPKTGDGQRDAAMADWQVAEGAAGSPYCDEWWTSLRPRLVEAARFRTPVDATGESDFTTNVKLTLKLMSASTYFKLAKRAALSDEEQDKEVLRNLTRSLPVDFTGLYGASPLQGMLPVPGGDKGALVEGLGRTVLGAGAFSLFSLVPGAGDIMESAVGEIAGFYVALYVVKLAAPMMQALVLMLIYGLLPLYLIVSEYEPASAITALVLVFVVSIFTMIFQLVDHLQEMLYTAMYPGASIWNVATALGIKPLILDAMILMLYVVGPALLLYLVTMAGQSIAGTGSSGGAGIDRARSTGSGIGSGAGRFAGKGSVKLAKSWKK